MHRTGFQSAPRLRCAAQLVLTFLVTIPPAAVQPYQFPDSIPGMSRSSRWSVAADGVDIRVFQLYTMGTNTSFGPGFDNSGPGAVALCAMDGTSTVTVTAEEAITSYDIRPKSMGITAAVDQNTMTFTVEQPCRLGIEINGNFSKPLFLFVNPPETDIPDPSDPSVTFFEKGTVHDIGDLSLTGIEQHTVYIEGGAVVLGSMSVRGNDVEVRGHGMLYSGPDSTKGPTLFTVGRSTGVRVRDFTVITHWDGNYGSSVWNSDTVSFTNWKMLNTAKDGLNPMGSQHMLVDSCFIFGDDDASAIKTSKYTTQDAAYITFQNCQIWNNSIEIGYETHGGDIHDIAYRNLDLIHIRVKSGHPNYPLNEMSIHVNDAGTVYNVTYEDIRIESSLSNRFFEFRIIYARYAAYPKNSAAEYRGHIRDVYLKNIRVIDGDNFPSSYIEGWDEDHLVRNLGIEGLFIYGQQVLEPSAGKVVINEHTRNVGFIPLGRGDTPPDPPAGLRSGDVSATTVSLRWTDDSDNEWGFTIERKSGDGAWEEVGIVNQNAESFTDSSAMPSTAYTYRVRSSNKAGYCSGAPTVDVTTDEPTGIGPQAPTGFTAAAYNSIVARLSWSSTAADIVGFVLERKQGDGGFVVLDTLAADASAYVDAGLAGETTYTYRLRAYSYNGGSAYANDTTTTPPLHKPDTVVDEMAGRSHWFTSDNWETFEKPDEKGTMEGDSLRARREENVAGTIVWAYENITGFETVLYHQRTLKATQLLGSSHYVDWYEIPCDIERTQSTVDNTWYKSVFTPMADTLRPNTHFLMLEVGVNSANWNPQLSAVTIVYGEQRIVNTVRPDAAAGLAHDGQCEETQLRGNAMVTFTRACDASVFSLTGRRVIASHGRAVDLSSLPPGSYALRIPGRRLRFITR